MASSAVSILLKATDSASAIFQRAVGTIGSSVQRIAGHATASLTPAFEKVRAQVARNAAVFAADFPRTAAIAGAAFAKIGAGASAMGSKIGAEARTTAHGAAIIGSAMASGLGRAVGAMRAAVPSIASGAARIALTAASGFRAAVSAAASGMARVTSLTISGFAMAGRAAVAGMARVRSAAVTGFHAAGNAALGFGKKLLSLVSGPLAAFAGAFAIGAILKKSIDAFAGAEERAHRLGLALKLNGEDAAKAVPDLQAFAKQLSSVTTVSVGATMKLVEMGARLKIPVSSLKSATQAAIGLSTALGIDQETALQRVNQALNGNFKALSRQIPQLRNAKNDTERLAIVNRFAADGFEMAKAKQETLAGSLERFGNLTHSVFKKIGSIVGPVVAQFVSKFAEKLPAIEGMLDNVATWFANMRQKLQPIFSAVMQHFQTLWAVAGVVFDGIKGILASFDSKFSQSGGIVGTVAGMIQSVTHAMAKGIITAFTIVETIVTDWSRIWKLAVTTVTLAIVMWTEDFKHTFGTVVPAYLAWFGRNWKQVFADLFNASLTIIVNFGKMMGSMLKRIWDFISSGMKGGISGLLSGLAADANRNLLEGFQATAEKIPQIMGRKLTATEKALADQAAALGTGVGNTFNAKLNERLGRLDAAVAGAAKGATDKAKKEMEALKLDQLGAKTEKAKKEKTENKAVESRFLTRAPGADAAMRIAHQTLAEAKRTSAITAKSHDVQQRQLRVMERQEKALSQFAVLDIP